MVNQFYPSPPINPLHRLSVRDGLEVNAERWEIAHGYHRHRQNIHYQSINQPGIVNGLGIRIIETPEKWSKKLKSQGRCLEIQPGIAIDVEGNPIVVNESIDRKFPFIKPDISGKDDNGEVIVYLVVSYVDNRRLTDEEYWKIDKEPWKEREWFRFDQQTNPPTETQVELCRIKLRVEEVASDKFKLNNPEDVFEPKLNQIDLRFRPSAKARPQALVNIATTATKLDNSIFPSINSPCPITNKNLSCLMQSLNVLYPSLQGNTEVANIDLEETFDLENIDLLHIPFRQIQNLSRSSNDDVRKEHLKMFRDKGGVILIEADSKSEGNYQNIISDINIKNLFSLYKKNPFRDWDIHDLDKSNLLKSKPFLFSALPLTKLILNICYSAGIIIVHGNLSSAWGGGENKELSRNDIRTAHELGINMLDFAWNRRNMMKLLSSNS
ncbi:hypothetical protein NIES267_09980 [Calothrix parasitica NIES-267]|uniref:DUF4159 domain-containing protein n=1 Tax=Calothrix parasitica NIES-267 TaxID=1973488 RepID=A0A1Z4LJW8_9CYAN|nr:hypothetical protein NIES267_09980 [Calothrix parasitica NIES-267]